MTVFPKKKILFVDQYASLGGGQRVLLDLMSVFKESDFDVAVLAPGGGELEELVRSRFSADVSFLSMQALQLNARKKNLIDLLKLISFSILFFFRSFAVFRKFDFIYCNGGRIFFPCALISLFLSGKRFIYHIHIQHMPLENRAIECISRLPATFRIFFNSKFIVDQWKLAARLWNQKFVLLENGLSREFSHSKFSENRFVDASTPKNLCVFGRVSSEKGQDILLDLFNEFPTLAFHIVGESDFLNRAYFDSLKKHAGNRIQFHGKKKDILQLMQTMPVHFSLVPSTWDEPFGLVAVESMAGSCITIVRARGGLVEIAENTGAMSFETTADLVKILKSLLQRPSGDLRELAFSQYSKTIDRYGYEKFRTRVLDAFKNSETHI